MAAIKFRTINWIANNPAGTYVAGDVLDFYYDPDLDTTSSGLITTEGFSVELNSVPITSGPSIPLATGEYYTLNFQGTSSGICKDTVRIIFGYPFGSSEVRSEERRVGKECS